MTKLQRLISVLDKNSIVYFDNILCIGEYACSNDNNIKNIVLDEKLECIERNAFDNCENLEMVYFEKNSHVNFTDKSDVKIFTAITSNNDTENSPSNTLTIQFEAFKDCKNLTSVILPENKDIIIEKNAFAGCELLRTVVATGDEINFCDNLFLDCPSYLTIICKKNSKIARYARENGFRSIYVD